MNFRLLASEGSSTSNIEIPRPSSPQQNEQPRSAVSFQCHAFDTNSIRQSLSSPQNYGDELGHWLITTLTSLGYTVKSELKEEQLGWSFSFNESGDTYLFHFAYRESSFTNWFGWIQHKVDPLGSVVKARRRPVSFLAAMALHDTLRRLPEIKSIRWHNIEEFEKGNENHWTELPALNPSAIIQG